MIGAVNIEFHPDQNGFDHAHYWDGSRFAWIKHALPQICHRKSSSEPDLTYAIAAAKHLWTDPSKTFQPTLLNPFTSLLTLSSSRFSTSFHRKRNYVPFFCLCLTYLAPYIHVTLAMRIQLPDRARNTVNFYC